MAGEHLRELDSLAVFERQEQEEVIKMVTGSMYHGEALHACIDQVHSTHQFSSSWFRNCACFSTTSYLNYLFLQRRLDLQ